MMLKTSDTQIVRAMVAGLALSASGLSLAQSAETKWDGDLELGYVSTSGNSETSNMKFRADAKRSSGNWLYDAHLDTLNAEEDGDRSAERYFLSNRLSYSYTKQNYWFTYGSYEDDRFSGYDYQATVAAGIGRRLIDSGTMNWDIEFGPGYRVGKLEEETADEKDDKEVIGRLFSKFSWQFSPNARFVQEIGVESGSDNTTSRSVTALKTDIAGGFALKLSYTVKYTEEVPDENKHADTETAVTLVYAF